jgi:DNA mismatch repair protein MSH3
VRRPQGADTASQELETRLAHLQPAEILIPEGLSKQTEKMIKHVAGSSSASAGSGRIRVERRAFPKGYDEAWRSVSRFYEEGMLQLSNATDAGKILAVASKLPHLALIAMAAAIEHLQGFGLENLFRIPNFASFADRNVMLLTSTTLDNLEIYRNSDGYREKVSAEPQLRSTCRG